MTRGIGVFGFGDPDVLRIVRLPEREPASGEVRIRVTAAAVNPIDILMRSGAYPSAFVPAGGRLLITGGAGWLATLVLGIARSKGIWTIADASPGDHKAVMKAGANHVIERGGNLAQRIRQIVPVPMGRVSPAARNQQQLPIDILLKGER